MKSLDSLLRHISLDQVFETIPSGLFMVDTERHIIYWNREAERITGFSKTEALGQHCSFLEGIPCGRGCGLFEFPIPKPVIGVSCSVKTRQGKRVNLLKNMDYLKDDQGRVIGGIESFIDVTEQNTLEKQLRRQAFDLEHIIRRRTGELEKERAQLGRVLDAMDDFAYITSAEHRIVFMNRAMTEAFGSQEGKTCYKIFHNRRSPCKNCPMAAILKGQTLRQERQIAKTDRTYEIIHTPLLDADGAPCKLAVYRDITERKQAEEQLREANRELDSFVHTVSHDLRTPLTGILGYAELLQELFLDKFDEQAADMLQEIEGQAQRMENLLEDLLVLARAGHLDKPDEPVDLAKVVAEVVEDHREAIKNGGIHIEIAPDLPKLSIPATLLAQVFTNLIGNAIRYAANSSAPIEVGSSAKGARVLLFVRDHGPGIPSLEVEQVFDLFYRGSTAENTPGTGVGLATVRKIVRRWGGSIWIEETPGGGSTFWMEFPG